jgi:FG-GAP-like repeat
MRKWLGSLIVIAAFLSLETSARDRPSFSVIDLGHLPGQTNSLAVVSPYTTVLRAHLMVLIAVGAGAASHATADTPLFLSPVVYESGGSVATSVAVADLNGDGKPDLVTSNRGSTSIGVLLNNGDGTFQPADIYPAGGLFTQAVAVTDVNGDHNPDVAVTSSCTDTADCSGLVGVLLGKGDGTFEPSVTHHSGGESAWAVAITDVNRDGRPDLLVTNELSDTVGVLLGNGDGNFQPAVTYPSGGRSPRLAVTGDMNGDGDPDVVVVNACSSPPGCFGDGNVAVLLGNGDGSFQTPVTYMTGGTAPLSVVLADVNGDRTADVVVGNACSLDDVSCSVGSIGVLLGRGDGTLAQAVSYSSLGLGTRSVAIADVNSDGNSDLLAASLCLTANCAEGTVTVLLGNGDGTFQSGFTYLTGAFGAESVAVADINGDHRPDVLAANEACPAGACTGGSVSVLLNNTPLTPARIDIEPGQFSNRLNVHSHALVRVAVLGTDAFDATTIDPGSVRFGRAGAAPLAARLRDVDRDGRLDAIFYFKVHQSGIACGDSSATLVGATREGQRFEGTDSIDVIGCR